MNPTKYSHEVSMNTMVNRNTAAMELKKIARAATHGEIINNSGMQIFKVVETKRTSIANVARREIASCLNLLGFDVDCGIFQSLLRQSGLS